MDNIVQRLQFLWSAGGKRRQSSGELSDESEDDQTEDGRPSWDTVENSINYGTYFHRPEDQFRSGDIDSAAVLDNALMLLNPNCTDAGKHPWPSIGTIVYHGGAVGLNEYPRDRPFFFSVSKEAAEDYGHVTSYKIKKDLQYAVNYIHWDVIAGNYGFDIDFSVYDTWEEFDNGFDCADFNADQKAAEREAHKVLVLYTNARRKHVVISSSQDEEFGIFPFSFDALQQIENE